MQQLEEKLDEMLVKNAPFQLPVNAKKTLVQILPWLTLVGGALALLAALSLYNALMVATSLLGTLNTSAYAYASPIMTNYVPMLWASLALLVAEAVLFFIAFPALKAQKKSGWNILFWVSLLNVAQAVVYVIGNQQIASFIFSLLSSLVGLYLLFQVRSYYTTAGVPTPPASAPKPPTTPPPAA